METTVNVYSVSDGKLIYSFYTDSPYKAGTNWNENINVVKNENSFYYQVIPSTVISATEIIENVQHLFVKPRYKEAYYILHYDEVSAMIENLSFSVSNYLNFINNAPNEVKKLLSERYNLNDIFDKIKNQITIKKGEILTFEVVNLENATKNVWVSLIDSYDPTKKIVSEVVSVTIMGDNVLTENLDTLDDIVFFGNNFHINNNFVIRKPTESELTYFTKKIKEA